MADQMRIPITLLEVIVTSLRISTHPTTWSFTTKGGNTVVATKATDADSIDFELNPND